jgi:hypothetical protein
MRSWPSIDALATAAPLPDGIELRLFRPDELEHLPAQWEAWYPTVRTGAESVFLEPAWLRANLVTTSARDRPVYAFAIEQDGHMVGMMSFAAEPAAQTLHARLGLLAPEARRGVLGALGFPVFEALGTLVGAELLLVWVTLASRIQQLMAQRRGFRLCGIVPGFDRDARGAGSVRVTEALYARLLVDDTQVELPDDAQLLPATRALLGQILDRP